MESLILDSDVIIDYLRGHPFAKQYFLKLESPCFISVITVAELYSGVKNREQEHALESCLQFFTSLPVDDSVAKQAGIYRQQYMKSHAVGMADALIAATADLFKLHLITLNVKHYPMLKKVAAPYKK